MGDNERGTTKESRAVSSGRPTAAQRSISDRQSLRIFTPAPASSRFLTQSQIETMDRRMAPSEREIAATQLGRQAARIDRFARSFSGPNTTSTLKAIDSWMNLSAGTPGATGEVMQENLNFLRMVEEGIIKYDPKLDRYRSNLRSQPGFQKMWSDQWLRNRFSAAFADEDRSLDNQEALEIGMLAVSTLLIFAPIARNAMALRRLRRFERTVARTPAQSKKLIKAVKDVEGRLIVNVGGRSASGEPLHAVNVQPELQRGGLPYGGRQILASAEEMDRFIPHGSVDAITSRNLVGPIDWNQYAQSAYRIAKPGAPIVINPYAGGPANTIYEIAEALRTAGFRNVRLRRAEGIAYAVEAIR